MTVEHVKIATKDGVCPTSVFMPEGASAWPAMIFYMDGLGIRPALDDMAQRIAREGYVVLLPDLFYRAGPYPPMDTKAIFAPPDARAALAPIFSSINKKRGDDTQALLGYLNTRHDVRGRKIGVSGYYMGGGMALTAAGKFPDRLALAASFHAGRLATDDPLSPHLSAPQMKAYVYVGAAVEDVSFPPEMAERLEQALMQAGVRHKLETYEGARYGWTMPDFPIYNHDQAERAHGVLIEMLRREL